MRTKNVRIIPSFLLLISMLCSGMNDLKAQILQVFNYTGSGQAYIVPTGITRISIEVRGAKGGDGVYQGSIGIGGKGGVATGFLNVVPGQVLNIFVGGQGQTATGHTYVAGGFNGGGRASSRDGSRGSGGGASDVRVGVGGILLARVIVGGGGGGACCTEPPGGTQGFGGFGGYPAGGPGVNGDFSGDGGTQVAGGAGADPGICPVNDTYKTGVLGNGGFTPDGCDNTVAGGGGGYYGGGAGNNAGGGSSYGGGVSNPAFINDYQTGNGLVIISDGCAPAPVITLVNSCLMSTPGVNYRWFLNGVLITGATSQTYFPSTFGSYTVEVTDGFGCVKLSKPFVSNVDFANNCPNLHKNFGATCDDGNPNTNNDRVRNDCTCRGDFFSSFITVKCPANMAVISTSKYGTVVNFDEIGMFTEITTAGNCGPMLNVKQTSGYYSGYPFPVNDLFYEEYVATDMCGNKASCGFYIRTTDVLPAASTDPAPDDQPVVNLSTDALKVSGISGISPNPVNDKLNVTIIGETETNTELRIVNILGQVLTNEKITLNKGINEVNLDVSGLITGIYFISTTQTTQAPMKFLKN